jgi:hypothetical protein
LWAAWERGYGVCVAATPSGAAGGTQRADGAADPVGAGTATRRQTSVVSSLPHAGQQAMPSLRSSPQTKQMTSLVSGITKAMRLILYLPLTRDEFLASH